MDPINVLSDPVTAASDPVTAVSDPITQLSDPSIDTSTLNERALDVLDSSNLFQHRRLQRQSEAATGQPTGGTHDV